MEYTSNRVLTPRTSDEQRAHTGRAGGRTQTRSFENIAPNESCRSDELIENGTYPLTLAFLLSFLAPSALVSTTAYEYEFLF